MKDITYSSLVLEMLPWCEVIAKGFLRKHYYNKENEIGDYVNSGVLGLFDAYRNYDSNKGEVKPYCFRYMYLEMNRVLISSNSYQLKKISLGEFGESFGDLSLPHFPSEKLYCGLDGSLTSHYEYSDILAAENLIVSLCVDRKRVVIDHYFRDVKIKDIAFYMGKDPSRVSQIHRLAIKELQDKASGREKNG
ncbi:hypothetical protein A1OS_15365 [Enterovibrio norvegicus]|uniref:sigma-70 family RNA polymerase sigma factor n=1 Tax=Enterovibrio norvegicus TaxID=188144 RepID=UPI000380EA7F|nr:sigma-70 family RNA polymerase sigma factor [Enterovibrio norvegicus]OEE65008.1 hypothetical protein A1OS_15365 [Enterovibrio norvegicus]